MNGSDYLKIKPVFYIVYINRFLSICVLRKIIYIYFVCIHLYMYFFIYRSVTISVFVSVASILVFCAS